LTVEENGVARSARPGDFTHIRWQMRNEIPAGSQGVARIRAKLQLAKIAQDSLRGKKARVAPGHTRCRKPLTGRNGRNINLLQ
jgi:hypothetical protein